MDNCTYVEVSKTLLQFLLIIIGWIIVHKLTSRRDIDKSRRDIITASVDKLCEQINYIVEKSHEYHTSERSVARENEIKRNLQDLSIRASSLKDLINDNKCQPVWLNVRKLKQAITGTHFEDEHQKAITDLDSQFEMIAEYEMSLKRALFDLKHSQFDLKS
jgi:hypothetical protein